MNNYELQIFVDNDTAMMIQAFTDVGVSIDFDRLLRLMADNSETIEDFIQSVEFNEPRMMLPIKDSGSDSNLLIVLYVQIMPDDLVMQLHRF